MDNDQIDEAIVARYPGRIWHDAVPMPSTSWEDGGDLLEQEEIGFDRMYAPGGWDGNGGVWRAYWNGPQREYAEGFGATMLVAGMLAILQKPKP